MNRLINFNAVKSVRTFWRQQEGIVTLKEPPKYSLHGEELLETTHVVLPQGLVVLAVDEAKKRKLLDVWTFHVTLWFGHRDFIRYEGSEAQGVWDAFKVFIFSKKKKPQLELAL